MGCAGKWLLAFGAAVLGIVLVAVPHVVPPLVERLAERKLAEFGFHTDVSLDLGYCWRNGPGVKGSLRVSAWDGPWRMKADFGASCFEWSAKVTIPETAFSEADPIVRKLMQKRPVPGVSNLVFSGSIALDAQAERTFGKPLPVWRVMVPLKGLDLSMMANGQEVSVRSFSVTAGASGIADHADVRTMHPRAACVTVGEFGLTNFHATVRATEKALIVNEAGAGFCGGKASVYSLYLNPETLNTGFTMFLEDVDAGEALAHLDGFQGEASGRLHGKLKAFVKEGGRAVRLRDMFLYSTPGETGKLKMANPKAVADNLAYAGLDDRARANVAEALADLDYKVLRMDLSRTGEKAARLSVRISGTATRGQVTVPVDLTVNINGELEQLINRGLGYSAKLKGRK